MNAIIRFLHAIRILKFFNLRGHVRLNGKRFRVPVLGESGYSNLDMSEPWMTELLRRLAPLCNGYFIDIGVNIGQTLLKLRAVSSTINYAGVEPNPACIHYVNRLIKANNFTHARLLPVGLSNQTRMGELSYYTDLEFDSMASTVSEFRGTQRRTRKEFIPLFDWSQLRAVLAVSEISIVKIDVEGGEWEVIDALSEELKRSQPIILMEILPAQSADNQVRIERQNKIHDRLAQLGYQVFLVIKSNEQLEAVEPLAAIPIHDDENRCEYVMVPASRSNQFLSLIPTRSSE
ncbi:MAG TPA: FkbM family methyltransferase [Cyclobacteriaceae bacterium]|nr:FkbM family methyltransferase [Cyclobacteriaceae bacterium]